MKEPEQLSRYIAEEMRSASRGSFPLSPGTMVGHTAISNLYWLYRSDILRTGTVGEIFGTDQPDPPVLRLPAGHRDVSIAGLNASVWESFIETAFIERPYVDAQTQFDSLVSTMIHSDTINFDLRLQGMKSHLVHTGKPVPSLLRAFLYENGFPEKNDFFDWVLAGMRETIEQSVRRNWTEQWTPEFQKLSSLWISYASCSFIPDDRI